MGKKEKDLLKQDSTVRPGRRNFLVAGGGFAAASLLSRIPAAASHSNQTNWRVEVLARTMVSLTKTDRRKLGASRGLIYRSWLHEHGRGLLQPGSAQREDDCAHPSSR